MNVALRPAMTRDEFLDWDGHLHGRWEFDGVRPVPMTGGLLNHNTITINIIVALRNRLRSTPWQVFGADAGIATAGSAVRYPDALVASSVQVGTSKLVADPVVVLEVLSPSSGRTDRIEKVKEYRAVPSIRRYLIVENTSVGAAMHHRQTADAEWTVTPLVAGETLMLPEIGIEVPLAEFYEDTGLPETEPDEGR